MKTFFVPALLVASLAACGGGGGGASAADVFNDNLQNTCAKAFECQSTWTGTAQQFTDIFGASEAACPAALTSQPDSLTAAEIQASVDAGRVTYNASDAQVCLDGIAAVTCADFWGGTGYPPECDTAFVGTVATDGACTIDMDCATSGDYCITNVCTPG